MTGRSGLEPTPDEFVAALVAVFREVRRVLRDDGTVWLNLGDSYATGGGRSVGRNDSGKEIQGRAVSSKTGGATGKVTVAGCKDKDLVGIPWMVAFALRADGWYLRSDIIWAKPNPMPESVTDRPTKAHEYLFLLSKGPRYFYDARGDPGEGDLRGAQRRTELPLRTGLLAAHSRPRAAPLSLNREQGAPCPRRSSASS
jgi:DNA modification methylase